MKDTISVEKTKIFNEYYPGGHTNLRRNPATEPVKHRLFIGGAKGSRVWDIDGNEYLEFNGSFGPTILGHGHPEYVKSLEEYLEHYPTLMGSLMVSADDIEVAEKLTKYIPCAEQLKFCTTGSEAVQMAIRIARAYTGKQKIVRFCDHYHGWFDNVLGGVIRRQDENGEWIREDPLDDMHYSFGRSDASFEESIILPWNDFEALEQAFERHHDEMAIVHFEAMMCNDCGLYPKPGFLEKIRELCTKYNVVMSVDEVITGIRLGLGGVQEFFHVTPDLCTMGKALSGGLPLSLVAGKKEIMNDLFVERKVLGPGTFNGWCLGMHAIATTLRILEKDDKAAYKNMVRLQEKLMDGIVDICGKRHVDIRITEAPGIFFTLFKAKGGRKPAYTMADISDCDFGYYAAFRAKMQEKGIMLLPGNRWYMSIAHTDADIDLALKTIDEVIAEMEQQ